MGETLARPSNHLASEASPYLQLHANNPVDWYPWGQQALARARAESKPIFLSVGYSTCYWCHVMERKVFSDPEIAAYMNEHFISIKVDREERPDVDEIYMNATRILTRSGGWPNSVFLTPDGEPFFAGTYFPPTDAHGRPGFPTVLRSMADAWENDRERVLQVARRVAAAIARSDQELAGGGASPNPGALLEGARAQLARSYESTHGGFSRRTKFPRPSTLEVLLVSYLETKEPATLAMITQTLDEMALGGIYDHLAGGFHRYSTEPTWSIPHFEKMLYDNAQLIGVYARAYQVTRRPLYRRVVEEVVTYLEREMTHPEGGFFSAQDAEVDGHEGASYMWSRAEIEAVLPGEKASEFLSVYELVPTREDPEKGVLRVRLSVEPALKRAGVKDVAGLLERFSPERAKLLAARNRREQPLRDDKVIAGWNGLAIRALVDAAEILKRPDYVQMAERAAHFVLERLGTPGDGLRRSYIAGQAREQGVLDDYAFLADGLLALYGATGKRHWLERAGALADTTLAEFEDKGRGGFYMTVEDSGLLVRPKTFEDGALPSGNGVALRVLARLASLTDEPRYERAAQRTLEVLAGGLEQVPSVMGTAIAALASTPTPGLVAQGSAGSGVDQRSRLPRSDDHVVVELERNPQQPLELIVRLVIDKGWHVNANPASLPFLIPTAVKFLDGVQPERIRYPAGKGFRPAFSDQALSVYEGRVEIKATLPEQAGRAKPSVSVRYQACDHERCLPPAVSHPELTESAP
ncbi:MAG: DUF255 domain-containing protein [Planctomycetota bacterium]